MSDQDENTQDRSEPGAGMYGSAMYELEFPAPELIAEDGRDPVLVHAMEGFSDAGHAIRLAAAHLRSSLQTEVVASFDLDQLLDYRSRRPLMTFDGDHFASYDTPELTLYAMRDDVGTPFLLLAGMEPDLHCPWRPGKRRLRKEFYSCMSNNLVAKRFNEPHDRLQANVQFRE